MAEYAVLPFMRIDRRRARGMVADVPPADMRIWKINSPDTHILVRVEVGSFPQEWVGNPNIRLKLDKLTALYPDEPYTYQDDNGDTVNAIRYGYFSENGRSTLSEQPIITLDDVEVW